MKNKNKKSIWIGIFLILLGTIMFFYWSSMKQVWFCDEIYTYESANGFEQDWPATYTDKWMSGENVEAFFSADSNNLSFNEITVRLYCDHVPLYFWLFRIVSFFLFKGSGSIWIGLSINLFFYLCFTVLIYRVFLYLTKNAFASGTVVVLTCIVNRLLLEQATILRMYMMLLLAEALLLFLSLRILKNVDRKKMSLPSFVFLFIISVFGFLTHYDFWIFYACTAMLCCLWLLFKSFKHKKEAFYSTKEFRYFLAWTFNFMASLLSTILIFPYSKWNLNRGKGQMALNTIFDFSSPKIAQIGWGYQRLAVSIFGERLPIAFGLGLILFFILIGGFILYKRKEFQKLQGLILIVLISQAYQLAVTFTMPDANEERYLWGSFTFMMLVMAWGCILLLQIIFSKIIKLNNCRICKLLISCILIIGIIVGEWSVIDNGKGICYLFNPYKDVKVLEENSEIPWIVYGPTVGVYSYSYYDWILPAQICFLTSDKTNADSIAVQELKNHDSFILYTYADYSPEALIFFEQELGKELSIEYLTTSTNLTVYILNVINN